MLRASPAACGPFRLYRLADASVASDVSAPWLLPFQDPTEVGEVGDVPAVRGVVDHLVYDGLGTAGGTQRPVRCRRTASAIVLDIEGSHTVHVGNRGDSIVRLAPAGTALTDLELEVLFGPALVVALAIRGVFCLHASGVRFGRRGAVFMGPSGFGKSTLARLAVRSPGRERFADDLVPIRVTPERIRVLPRYPQMKLFPGEQWGLGRPEAISVEAIYDIGVPADSPSGAAGARIRPLRFRDAVFRLARYTVASRLFDRTLTERHLAFCEELARRVPVRELVYERSLDLVPAVVAAVERDLADPRRAT